MDHKYRSWSRAQDSRSILLEMAILGTVPMPDNEELCPRKRQWTIFLRQQWHWTTTSQEYHLIGTRIWRAALPPGCDPVRSPMCGCTPTVDSAVTSQIWIDIEIVSQYFGCKLHWACTHSRRSDMVLMRASWIMDPHSVVNCWVKYSDVDVEVVKWDCDCTIYVVHLVLR